MPPISASQPLLRAADSESVEGRRVPVSGGCAAELPDYRFVLLGEIANFTLLRRHLGVSRAGLIVEAVVARVGAALPRAHVAATGRSGVEVHLVGECFEDGAAALARVHAAFALPIMLGGEGHVVRIVFGGAGQNAGLADRLRLTELAESTMQEACAHGRDMLRDVACEEHTLDPLALMRELPAAMANGDVFLQYQPKISVRRQEVASVEALIRWRHPVHGVIPPNDFIGIVEQHHHIAALTLWTLDRAMADQATMAAAGHDHVVFINISGILLSDTDFVRAAAAIVNQGPFRIGFEITETAVIRDPESAIRNLRLLTDIGVRLAIDDYGAGLSSLAYLKQLPAQELKIDKLFVTQLTSSNRDPLIVRSTIDLAHALGMEVVAEGVETSAALALLSVMGCDMVQGYLISRPLDLDALIAFMGDPAFIATVAKPRLSFRRPDKLWKAG